MLSPVSGFGGNGSTVPCVFCRADLGYGDVEADRIVPGGSYRRDNVQPACRPCNLAKLDDADADAATIAARVAATFARTGRLTPSLG